MYRGVYGSIRACIHIRFQWQRSVITRCEDRYYKHLQPWIHIIISLDSGRDKFSINTAVEIFAPVPPQRLPRYCSDSSHEKYQKGALNLAKYGLECVDSRAIDGAWGLAFSDNVLYVSSFGADLIVMLNASNGHRIGTIGDSDTLDCPSGLILYDNKLSQPTQKKYLIAANFCSNNLVLFDLKSGQHVTFAQQSQPIQYENGSRKDNPLSNPSSLLVDCERNRLILTNYKSNSIVMMNLMMLLDQIVISSHSTSQESVKNISDYIIRTIENPFISGPMGLTMSPYGAAYLMACYKVSLHTVIILINNQMIIVVFVDR